MRTGCCAVAVVVVLAVLVFAGCVTPEPEPPLVGDLTRSDVETVMKDAMVVTAAHVFRLVSDEYAGQTEGQMVTDSSTFTWTDTDMESNLGSFVLRLENYLLQSSLFGDVYEDYVFTGTVTMVMTGDAAALTADLACSHAKPELFPVTTLVLDLSNLEDNIAPDAVEGSVVVNGYDVPVPVVVEALQIEVR